MKKNALKQKEINLTVNQFLKKCEFDNVFNKLPIDLKKIVHSLILT